MKLGIQLVRAADIARHRLAANPPEPGVPMMLAWFAEVQRAKDELRRGEWTIDLP